MSRCVVYRGTTVGSIDEHKSGHRRHYPSNRIAKPNPGINLHSRQIDVSRRMGFGAARGG